MGRARRGRKSWWDPSWGTFPPAALQPPSGCKAGRGGSEAPAEPRGSAKMEAFSSRNLALQAEKKLLSRMASKSTVTMFIDETSAAVLDELYRISKEHTQDRVASQKVIKDLVKVAVKVSVLFRNGRFSEAELAVAEDFKRKLRQGAMTAVSFHQVAFTFERAVLGHLLEECRDLLLRLVEKHLTPKSHGRIRNVFDHFADAELLGRLYSPGSPFEPHLERVCQGLNQLMDQGKL